MFEVKVVVKGALEDDRIPNAEVKFHTSTFDYPTVTDENGEATLYLPAGVYSVFIKSNGFYFQNESVTISANVELDFTPSATPVENIDLELAESIWTDAKLPLESFEYKTEWDAIEWVAKVIIPEAKSFIQAALEEASTPYGYPLPQSILEEAFAEKRWKEISVTVTNMDALRINSLRMYCMYLIFLFADSIDKDYISKAEAFRRAAIAGIESLTGRIRAILNESSKSGRKFGLIVFKTAGKREGCCKRNDFKWPLCG